MLVITRKQSETTELTLDQETLEMMLADVREHGTPIQLTVLIVRTKLSSVRIGIEAPKYVKIRRGELFQREDTSADAEKEKQGNPVEKAESPVVVD